jgi:MOSC domain-containing protein YiiM
VATILLSQNIRERLEILCSGRWCRDRKSVQAAAALEGCGLEGDRYCAGTGHWSRFGRVCEVTFIAAEDLHNIEREIGVGVKNGEHRRNVVTREISLKALRRGERFRIGEVAFEYRGPRSVNRYSNGLPNRV